MGTSRGRTQKKVPELGMNGDRNDLFRNSNPAVMARGGEFSLDGYVPAQADTTSAAPVTVKSRHIDYSFG